jgi:hypothetical protein
MKHCCGAALMDTPVVGYAGSNIPTFNQSIQWTNDWMSFQQVCFDIKIGQAHKKHIVIDARMFASKLT